MLFDFLHEPQYQNFAYVFDVFKEVRVAHR